MKRIRTTIWETSDGQRWTDEKAAILREKQIALTDLLEPWVFDQMQMTNLLNALLVSERIIIVLKPTAKGDRA